MPSRPTVLKLVHSTVSEGARDGHPTDDMVRVITAAIADKRLLPGARLEEQELEAHFELPRSLVVQGLSRLGEDGLVTFRSPHGSLVTSPEIVEIKNVLAIRKILESNLVQQLCEQITESDIAELRNASAAELENYDSDDEARCGRDWNFHRTMVRLVGNEVLVDILEKLNSRCCLLADQHQDWKFFPCSAMEHLQIVEALAHRDSRQCSHLMSKHIDTLERHLQINPHEVDLKVALGNRER